MKLTQEQTDKIFNAITSNRCREMDEIRFNQAVNEVIGVIKKTYSLTEEIKSTCCEEPDFMPYSHTVLGYCENCKSEIKKATL